MVDLKYLLDRRQLSIPLDLCNIDGLSVEFYYPAAHP